MQHTAPVRAKPDSRPRLEGARYKIPNNLLTSYVSLLHSTRHAYTSTHLTVPLLSLASALEHYEVSVLRSNNERTNERMISTLGALEEIFTDTEETVNEDL